MCSTFCIQTTKKSHDFRFLSFEILSWHMSKITCTVFHKKTFTDVSWEICFFSAKNFFSQFFQSCSFWSREQLLNFVTFIPLDEGKKDMAIFLIFWQKSPFLTQIVVSFFLEIFDQNFKNFISFLSSFCSKHFVIIFQNFRRQNFLSHLEKNVTLTLFPVKIYFFQNFQKSKKNMFFVIPDLFPYVLATFDSWFEVWKIFGFLWREKRLCDLSHFLKKVKFLTQIVVSFFLKIFDQNFEILFHLSHVFALNILW